MDVVKVPAQTASSGATNKERSAFLDGLRPALRPAAWKPEGAVIPPETGAQVTDGVIGESAKPTRYALSTLFEQASLSSEKDCKVILLRDVALCLE
jgi:hypothetical protein